MRHRLVPFIVIVAFLSCTASIIVPNLGSDSHRQRYRISYSKTCMRAYNAVADAYWQKNHFFPPMLDGKPFYGPISDSIYAPFILNIDKTSTLPLVDPNRTERIFPDETMKRSLYFRPPAGEKIKYKGYPYRYFRSADGHVAVILSNGPDMHADLSDKELIRMEAQLKKPQAKYREIFVDYTYDPTNGTYSNGDIWRYFEAPK